MNENYERFLAAVQAVSGTSFEHDPTTLLKIVEAARHDPHLIDQISNYTESGCAFGGLTQFLNTCDLNGPSGAIPYLLTFPQIRIAEQITKAQHRVIAINKARQSGMSTLLSGYALHQAVCSDDQNILIVAPRQAQAAEHLHIIEYLHRTSSLSLPQMSRTRNTIEFENGSTIRISGPLLKGHSLTHAIVDEAAYFSGAEDDRILPELLVCLSPRSGKLILSSTPNQRRGMFWEVWADKSYPADRLTISWHGNTFGSATITNYKLTLGVDAWRNQFENQFL